MITVKVNQRPSRAVPVSAALLVCGGLALGQIPAQAAHRAAHASGAHRTGSARRLSTPKDSYLEYKVYTVDQLIEQVSQNAAVRQRFARHFHIPEERVVSYMQANLVESYVPQTTHYTVYCVHPNGRFYKIHQTFRRGTKVFALKNGEPVMKWLCGNPLMHLLPDVTVKYLPETQPPIKKVSPFIQELIPTETANILIPAEVPAPVFQPAVPISLVSAAATPLYGRGASSLLPFLLPVALLGINGGGGHTPTPAVPEPSSLVFLAAAAPVVFIAVRRRVKMAKSG